MPGIEEKIKSIVNLHLMNTVLSNFGTQGYGIRSYESYDMTAEDITRDIMRLLKSIEKDIPDIDHKKIQDVNKEYEELMTNGV